MRNTAGESETLLLGYAGPEDIRSLFELLGMVAKIDDPVSPEQIREVERFMRHHLSDSQRGFAIAAFRAGKEIPFVKGPMVKRAFQLYVQHAERWLEPAQVLDILLRVAFADNKFSASEEYIIDTVRLSLAIHKRTYWTLRDTLGERLGVAINLQEMGEKRVSFATHKKPEGTATSDNKRKDGQPRVRAALMTKAEALVYLELGAGADPRQIKIAYRKLVKRYHPDLADGARASEEQLQQVVERFRKVQEAYEVLLDT